MMPKAKPKPNDHGYYAEAMCTVFEWEKDRSYIRIRVVEGDPGVFYSGHDFQYGCGNCWSSAGGPWAGERHYATLGNAA
jgi:hypothetical protein